MKKAIILACFMVYAGIWWHFKNQILWSDRYLSMPLPVPVLKVVSGYGQHMVGFSLFVKTAIFTGGNNLVGIDERTYADPLAQNYEAAARLYPEFIDTYFFNQSFLPHISQEYAKLANRIHDHGIAARPDYLYIPFFKAFNYIRYLDQPLKAGEIFAELAKRPEAPPWFGSLSSKLMARGGRLSAGRDMLQLMYEGETHEEVRQRYARELVNFDKALRVQALLDRYHEDFGREAEKLEDLIPRYLARLPDLDYGYTLEWDPPTLKMVHPATK